MSDDQNPPAESPAETPAPAEAPVEAAPTTEAPAEAVEAESTRLPANESISEMPSESISEPIPDTEKVAESTPSRSEPKPIRDNLEMLGRANTVRHAHMQKNLDAIMAELEKSGTISNNGVQKLLKTSNATAIRYLSMLVKQGKIKREGKGRGVVYVAA